MGDFDWDDSNRDHLARHGVSPEEAEQVYWNNPVDRDFYEVEGEKRYVYIGHTNRIRVLVLVITERGPLIRVVTCFDPPAADRASYLRSLMVNE